jgi:hypothetical protein
MFFPESQKPRFTPIQENWKNYYLCVLVCSVFEISSFFLSYLVLYRCPLNSGHKKTVIWQNMEKCKEGEVVANDVFPISSDGIFYLDKPLRRYTLYIINSKKLRRYCDVGMRAKGVCFQSRGWGGERY